MAVLSGYIASGWLRADPPVHSQDLGQHVASFGGGVLGSPGAPGALAGTGVVALVSQGLAGSEAPMFGGELFEKIIVVPRKKSVGFVLSTQIFAIEVWNTHLRESKTLASIVIGGVGGLQITGGISAPGVFGPGRGATYTATLGTDGDATIANIAEFIFDGESGTETVVTGSRLTVFSPEIDWSEPFEETIAYMTNIIPAYSGHEQRIQLRTIPRFGASFRVLTATNRDTAALDALISGWQARVYGVPWWMDASPLVADAAPGTLTLQVDTTNRASFEAGGLVMLWRDQHTWEALQVFTKSDSQVTLVSETVQSWSAGDLVVPLKRGRLSDTVTIARETSGVASMRATFACEVV